MLYYARSSTKYSSKQPYSDHIKNVLDRGLIYVNSLMCYIPEWDSDLVRRIYEQAAEYHDLGKLDDENQEVLIGNIKTSRLPVPHSDAGVAYLCSKDAYLSALLVYAHHAGLPDCNSIDDMRNKKIKHHVDRLLPEYLMRHEVSVCSNIGAKPFTSDTQNLKPIDVRVLFSCLTHADHGDAAQASNEEVQDVKHLELRASERLESLHRFVDKLGSENKDTDRNLMRTSFFTACAESRHESAVTICDAPVGTGKTTAVMANLLSTAARHSLRRIFVILPFTNIITQSVKIYRKSLVLPGECAENAVAEIHHRADFEDIASRKLTALWDAPIVVTTAVTFFETLASATPSTLRRLQNLPGSAVFLDEAHAMLPVKLLPLAWSWIQYTASSWSCHWILASGSLCHFWQLEEFGNPESLPNVIPKQQRDHLNNFEVARVQHRFYPESMSLYELSQWLMELEGPIIVVLNTVHTAAAAAKSAENIFGKGNVMHLSTALTSKDREYTLDAIKKRLENKEDKKWCLFATSCVEAGVDLSFKTGVRESSSLLSLLQLAGRVNRNSEHEESEVWTILLDQNDSDVTKNSSFDISSRILNDYFNQNKTISPTLCTDAMKKEVRESVDISKKLIEQESCFNFKTIEKDFKVIEDQSQLAIVDKQLIKQIQNYEDISWRDIQNGSVRVREKILKKLAIQESNRYPGLWLWEAEYSTFLGYMEAVLKIDQIDKDGYAIF